MNEIVDLLTGTPGQVAGGGALAVALSSLLAAVLPRPVQGSKLGLVFRVIDALAFNWGAARNARQG